MSAGKRPKCACGIILCQRFESRQMALFAAVAKSPCLMLGPAPAPVVKVNNRYRYRVTVIGRNDKTLRGLLAAFMKEFSKRGENRNMQIYTDCNLMD